MASRTSSVSTRDMMRCARFADLPFKKEYMMSTIMESLKEKIGVIIVTAAVSVATVFSDKIVGSIKAEINKSDQRPAQEAIIAKDISVFIVCAESALEFIKKGETTKKELHFVVDPYNDAVTTLRTNEYVYLAAVQRYWDRPALQ